MQRTALGVSTLSAVRFRSPGNLGPSAWSPPPSPAALTNAAMDEDASAPAAAATGTAARPGNALLRGMPTGAVGQRSARYGYTNKYGFRYSVLTRPPSAG